MKNHYFEELEERLELGAWLGGDGGDGGDAGNSGDGGNAGDGGDGGITVKVKSKKDE